MGRDSIAKCSNLEKKSEGDNKSIYDRPQEQGLCVCRTVWSRVTVDLVYLVCFTRCEASRTRRTQKAGPYAAASCEASFCPERVQLGSTPSRTARLSILKQLEAWTTQLQVGEWSCQGSCCGQQVEAKMDPALGDSALEVLSGLLGIRGSLS